MSIAAAAQNSKSSRYEDIWTEDVHTAFMEAVAIYPPMGKRRLKYYQLPKEAVNSEDIDSIPSRIKSFGRCQLIQSYILHKTGKNRTRKQVSSHLQRLKKIHRGDSTSLSYSDTAASVVNDCVIVRTLLSELPRSPSTFTLSNVSGSDDLEQPLHNGPPFNPNFFSSCDYQPPDFLLDEEHTRRHASAPCSPLASANRPPNHQATPGSEKSTENEYPGYRYHALQPIDLEDPQSYPPYHLELSTTYPSMSMRRLASNIPVSHDQLEPPRSAFPFQMFCTGDPQTQYNPLHHDSSGFTMVGLPCSDLLTPVEQLLPIPLQPPQAFRQEKKRNPQETSGFRWTWSSSSPHNLSVPPSSHQNTSPEQCADLCAAQSYVQPLSEIYRFTSRFNLGHASYSSLPKRLSYLHPQNTISFPSASSPLVSMDHSTSNVLSSRMHMSVSLAEDPPASPLIIKPTPLYPAAYSQPENQTATGSSVSPI
ncbi:hypothetical protein SERLA73DRAFT_75984 [Serpula lacrymans var. lacrymans S7.3]|uniref:TEA domain-containing protein n=2 Tax=Serpula lacrymans var. lacrymans TaxID=341189 RepID=F8Q5U3_SERL3|nr:uncharacterized protein SERLADRAFT_440761 [Serpula lacrymans var. lacrymans S7.9]EGN95981.1 hypothetical protein SERLA73DRAFT_75984 [Serpula lacrymans var. lacrymans S7.3]EGO21506.1 hypothetical protein SERLADRAFT_440761 [Serpula lacrymans var. lacrymans S7.9]